MKLYLVELEDGKFALIQCVFDPARFTNIKSYLEIGNPHSEIKEPFLGFFEMVPATIRQRMISGEVVGDGI